MPTSTSTGYEEGFQEILVPVHKSLRYELVLNLVPGNLLLIIILRVRRETGHWLPWPVLAIDVLP